MSTVNGVPFRQWLVPSSKYNIKAPYTMIPKKITLHNTDNQMPAVNEISYMRNNNNQTSYHLAIDEKEAIQGLPYNRNSWNSGDGGNGYGNRNTVSVEICRNYDRSRKTTNLNDPLKSQYSKAELNTIKFIAQLCIDLGIVANNDNIKTHNDWNGKWCPSKILNENRLQAVKNAIIAEYNRLKGNNVNPSKPVKPSTNKPKPAPIKPRTTKNTYKVTADGYLGPETVKALQTHFGLVVDGEMWGQNQGNQATKAFNQKAVKYGRGGSPVVKALQRKIGASPVDGIWGADTTRALQRYLGTPVDGEIWKPSTAIKELQKRLNNGTF